MSTRTVFVDVGSKVVRKSDGVKGQIVNRRLSSWGGGLGPVTLLDIEMTGGAMHTMTLGGFAKDYRAYDSLRDEVNPPIVARSWKVDADDGHILLTLNGQVFNLDHVAESLIFDLRAALDAQQTKKDEDYQ